MTDKPILSDISRDILDKMDKSGRWRYPTFPPSSIPTPETECYPPVRGVYTIAIQADTATSRDLSTYRPCPPGLTVSVDIGDLETFSFDIADRIMWISKNADSITVRGNHPTVVALAVSMIKASFSRE